MAWFFAEDILAHLRLDPNSQYIALAQLCERLGLNRARQERRVHAHGLLHSSARRLAIETEAGIRHQLCLPVEMLPFWLTTLDATEIQDEAARTRLELFQRECASVIWQSFRPQGFGSGDQLLPQRHHQTPAEQAYAGQLAMAAMARQQMLLERRLDTPVTEDEQQGHDPWASRARAVDDPTAARLAQTVRRVAQGMAERSRRNEYHGIYSGLYRNFGISSYRRMPPARLHEALEWLERWYGDMIGEPEPPPDI